MKRNRLHSEWKEKPPKRDDTSDMDETIASIERVAEHLKTLSPESVIGLYIRAMNARNGTDYIP